MRKLWAIYGRQRISRITGIGSNREACGKSRKKLRTIRNKKPLPTWV